MRSLPLAVLALLQVSAGGHGGSSDSSAPRSGQVSVLASRPSDMVQVAAGPFAMGRPESDEEFEFLHSLCAEDYRSAAGNMCRDVEQQFVASSPVRDVQLDAFEIDRYEVTVAQYRACVRSGACDIAPLLFGDQRHNKPELPVGNISWQDANDYCGWRGKRLPSEAEWEKAARGVEARRFPWGASWVHQASNHGGFSFKWELEFASQAVSNIGGLPLYVPEFYVGDDSDGAAYALAPGTMVWDESPYGAMDMAGNVSEWVSDYYAESGYADLSTINPLRDSPLKVETRRVVRSGSWLQPRLLGVSYARRAEMPGFRAVDTGFRCAR